MSSNVPVTGPLAERLAVRDLEVGYDGVAGRLFSDRLSVRYGLDALQPDRVLTVRYELTRRLYLEAASGLASSLDLVYRRDF
jgi:translocation and assembly module TamB